MCQTHPPRPRKPQGCGHLPNRGCCRSSGRNEIECYSHCRRRARKFSAHRLAAPAPSGQLAPKWKAVPVRRWHALQRDRYTRSGSPVAMMRSEPQWQLPVRSIDLLPFWCALPVSPILSPAVESVEDRRNQLNDPRCGGFSQAGQVVPFEHGLALATGKALPSSS
jgi:hypothetical protein